ncbi:MAG: class IV adenylate cyclase [Planctomycetota bacterium]|jgi:adenylate cyclase class 2
MRTEIEAKLRVESHEDAIEKLAELGAEFLQEQMQTDYYFDDANRSLTQTDRCLRLRHLVAGETVKFLLTYKGAREKRQPKKRAEIEIEIGDGDSAKRLLSQLGYETALVVEKKRRIWRLGPCEVALDELPTLGSFVEIEGPEEKEIASVQKELGLAHLPHIAETYACLMANKLGRRSSGQ